MTCFVLVHTAFAFNFVQSWILTRLCEGFLVRAGCARCFVGEESVGFMNNCLILL